MTTRLQQILTEHAGDRDALVEALVAFNYRDPDPGPARDPLSAEWYWGALDDSAGRDTLGELEERVAMKQCPREVYNEVVKRLGAANAPAPAAPAAPEEQEAPA